MEKIILKYSEASAYLFACVYIYIYIYICVCVCVCVHVRVCLFFILSIFLKFFL